MEHLKFEKSFRLGVAILIALNVITSATAMVLIEKMIPTHNEEFVRLQSQEDALSTLLNSSLQSDQANSKSEESMKISKLIVMDTAGWGSEQEAELAVVRGSLEDGSYTQMDGQGIYQTYRALLEKQRLRVRDRLDNFRSFGLAGSWSVATMSLLTLFALYLFRSRSIDRILNPLSEIVHGLRDWSNGNRMRRLHSKNASKDIAEGISIMNELLDSSPASSRATRNQI